MTLLLDNEDVRAVLTMDVTMRALDEAYTGLAAGDVVCRPRIDIRIPTDDADKTYRWGTMEGRAAGGGQVAGRQSGAIQAPVTTRYLSSALEGCESA